MEERIKKLKIKLAKMKLAKFYINAVRFVVLIAGALIGAEIGKRCSKF